MGRHRKERGSRQAMERGAVRDCLRQLAPCSCAAIARRRQTGLHEEERCATGAHAVDELDHQTPEPLTRVDPQHGAAGDCTGHHCPKNPPLGSRIRDARLLQPCLASGVPAELRVFGRGKPVTCIKTGDCRMIQGTVAVRAHSGSALNERMDAWMHGCTDGCQGCRAGFFPRPRKDQVIGWQAARSLRTGGGSACGQDPGEGKPGRL